MTRGTKTSPEPPEILRARLYLAKIHLVRALERYVEFKNRPLDLDHSPSHFSEYLEARRCAQCVALSVRQACRHLGMPEGEMKL